MDHKGWFTGPNGEFVFWVPSYLRPCNITIDTKLVIASLGSQPWLDVTHFIHGQEWQRINDRNSESSMSR